MKITLLGAAGGEVTGSCYIVETKQERILVDCGIFHDGNGNPDHDAIYFTVAPEAQLQ